MSGLFDVHAHLTHRALAPRVDEILDHAARAGVTTIVSNGLNPEDNAAVLALAARSPMVRPALGLYPVDAVLSEMRGLEVPYPRESEHEPTAEEALAWLRDHVDDAFAIGEIGLDGYWVPEALWERQEQVFRSLLALALEADKPVILHTRKRERRALEILREMKVERADFHCFGGKLKLAREIADCGYYLSVPANARRSEVFSRMLSTLPRDRLLLETDCPYMAPQRDQESAPEHVALTCGYAAELWGMDEAAAREQLAHNFARLFRAEP